MKWLLVVFVLDAPVKTDLVYETLSACLAAEQEMRQKWADIYNHAAKSEPSSETLNFIRGQITSGTCIPAK